MKGSAGVSFTKVIWTIFSMNHIFWFTLFDGSHNWQALKTFRSFFEKCFFVCSSFLLYGCNRYLTLSRLKSIIVDIIEPTVCFYLKANYHSFLFGKFFKFIHLCHVTPKKYLFSKKFYWNFENVYFSISSANLLIF